MNDLVGAASTVAGALQRTVADEDPAIAVTPIGVCTGAAVALVAASQVSNTAAAKQSGARWTLSLRLRPPSAITPRPAIPTSRQIKHLLSCAPALSTYEFSHLSGPTDGVFRLLPAGAFLGAPTLDATTTKRYLY